MQKKAPGPLATWGFVNRTGLCRRMSARFDFFIENPNFAKAGCRCLRAILLRQPLRLREAQGKAAQLGRLKTNPVLEFLRIGHRLFVNVVEQSAGRTLIEPTASSATVRYFGRFPGAKDTVFDSSVLRDGPLNSPWLLGGTATRSSHSALYCSQREVAAAWRTESGQQF